MRILVAGTGSIGLRHIRNIRNIDPDSEFVFLRADARRDALSSEYEATIVSSFQQALSMSVDCVVIATPSALHATLIVDAIKANIPMYIEKPVVVSRQELTKVKVALSSHNYRAATMVGCNLRFLRSMQKLRGMLSSGDIGDVVRACMQAGQWLPDWRPNQDYRNSYSSDPRQGGGVVLDLVHELDAARWLLGDFDSVRSLTEKYAPLNIETESVAAIILGSSKRGQVISIGLDYIARPPIRRYEFIGSKGTLHWDLLSCSMWIDTPSGREYVTRNPDDFDVAQTYRDAMSEFLHAVVEGNQTSQDIAEGLKSAELAVLAKES